MVGMDAHDKSIERDCGCEASLELCAQANGNVLFHFKDCATPITVQGNTKVAALCPTTPTLCRENGDSGYVTCTPLSAESPQSRYVDGFISTTIEQVVGSDLNGSPRTPDEGVFDPFAPGPDEMLLAPICKKIVKKSHSIVARQLNFDDIDEFPASKGDKEYADTLLSEKLLLESVYESLLEAIISKQSEEFFAENQRFQLEDPLTPTSSPPKMGVAETCPGAPVKPAAAKSRNIDFGLCRKLEF